MNGSIAKSEDQKRLTVMLVDDSQVQIEFQQALLAHPDVAFLLAYDGETALALCEQHHPDIILLDMEMPGLSGLEVAKILRSNTQTQDIPIIMVSAETSGDVIEEAFCDGCSEYVVKPIHKIDIMAKIQSLTGVQLLEQL